MDRDIPDGMTAIPLSEKAQRVRALELAQVVADIDQHLEDWKITAKAHRDLIGALEERRATLAEDVRTGTELVDAQGELPVVKGNGRRSDTSA